MSSDREMKFFMARVAAQAERHLDVVGKIGEIIASDPVLRPEERNMLSVAYKAITGSRRSTMRSVNKFLEDPAISENRPKFDRLAQLKADLVHEIDIYCGDLIRLIDEKLYPAAKDAESRVFYQKLKADYIRYSIEFKSDEEKNEGSDRAKESYNLAMKIATQNLEKANPQLLGLYLNFSVFLYEICQKNDEAIQMAEKAYKDGVDLLDKLPGDEYSESTLILQLLKDNIQLWKEQSDENK